MSPLELVLAALPAARRVGKEYRARCPAHDDSTPSLNVRQGDDGRVLIICRAGCSTESVCQALGLRAADLFPREVSTPSQIRLTEFGPSTAQRVWRAASARARDDEHIDADRAVYSYLSRRRLDESWETRSYGIVAQGMALPEPVRGWPNSGHQIVAPLYDLTGKLVSLQGRRIRDGMPKTLFPKGARAKGTVFANEPGLCLLRGDTPAVVPVIFGEGLTDHLAFCLTTGLPALCAPGAMTAESCIGAWCRDRELLLALDCDAAGDGATDRVARKAFDAGASRVRRLRWPEKCVDACDALWTMGTVRLGTFLDQLAEVPRDVA